MDVLTMSRGVRDFLDECATLSHSKNIDYHPDNVAYLEILQTAFETNITVEQDLWGRIRKQMSALRRFVIDGHVESEPPKSRMMDVAVYMAIMWTWEHNKHQIMYDAIEFVEQHRRCDETGLTGDATCIGHEAAYEWCDRCLFLKWLRRVDTTLSAQRS